jgi:hypothetical protein
MRHYISKREKRPKTGFCDQKGKDYTAKRVWALLRASGSVLEGFFKGVCGMKKRGFLTRKFYLPKIDSRYDSNIF